MNISAKYGIQKWGGLIYNSLTILGEPFIQSDSRGKTHSYVECRCVCGNTRTVRVDFLIHNIVKSCGCLKHKSHSTTHGESKSRLYSIWVNMKTRCYNPNGTFYAMYGGRGISICQSWRDSYVSFRDWALSNGYEEQSSCSYVCTIDRIDNNGDYCPENCRWVNMTTQSNNRSSCDYITRNGKTMSLKQWCNGLGLPYKSVYTRIKQRGWDIETALSTPFRHHKTYKSRAKRQEEHDA